MTRKQTLLTVASFLSVLAFISPAHASVLYTDFSSFMTDVGALTVIDFEENSPNSFTSYGSPGFASFSGVAFNSAGNLFTIDPDFSAPFYDWGSGDVLSDQFSSNASFNITLPGGFGAVGTDIMSFDPYLASIKISLSTGEEFMVNTNDFPNRAFFGFISNNPITSLVIDNLSGSFLNLDNFSFGDAIQGDGNGNDHGVIPEPSSLALMTIGLSGLASLKRRRK